jgi:hypothetical protein
MQNIFAWMIIDSFSLENDQQVFSQEKEPRPLDRGSLVIFLANFFSAFFMFFAFDVL